ncbi:MAG: maleylpyruvate isomerase N-terminal domain-containing protein, partial [Ilumatobacter sp.]
MRESPLPPHSNESTAVRALVVEAVEAAAELMARPSVGVAWNEPSALDGMTVGGLAAHLVRAAGATLAYLDRTPVDTEPDGDLLTPVTYFRAAVEAPIHEQIKQVSADESAIGHEATATKCSVLAAELGRRLEAEPADRLVGALGGRMLTLDDFCRTRLIEVLLHVDDLAVSVGEERPETHASGTAIVIDIVGNIARDVHGDWTVLYALARSERLGDDPVF